MKDNSDNENHTSLLDRRRSPKDRRGGAAGVPGGRNASRNRGNSASRDSGAAPEWMTIHVLGAMEEVVGESSMEGITFVADSAGPGDCRELHGGRALILTFPGTDFASVVAAGAAYAYDPAGELLHRSTNPAKRILPDTPEEKTLKRLVREHVAVTNSPRAKELLEDWKNQRGNFVKVEATRS